MAYEIYHKEWAENRPVLGVLFDMDGLVLDSEILYTRFWRKAAEVFGYCMSQEQAVSMCGLGKQAGQNNIHRYFGTEADYYAIRNKRIELMEAYVDEKGIDLKPGVRELLDHLEENRIPAAITSSSPIPRIQKYLAFHGLEARFAALCSGRDVPKGKPAPDIYLKGAQALGLDPRNCLALEDAPAGILSAYRAGCLTVMVPDQKQPDGETEALLYAKADTLADIIPMLK